MTPFTQFWITATLAPESITIVRESPIGALILIRNEKGDNDIKLIEDLRSNTIIGIGKTYEDVIKVVSLSYSQAAQIISKEFNLISIQL